MTHEFHNFYFFTQMGVKRVVLKNSGSERLSGIVKEKRRDSNRQWM